MKALLYISIIVLVISCTSTKPKSLEEYRQEAMALDSELGSLDSIHDELSALLGDSAEIKYSNPSFNLDTVKIELSANDSIMHQKAMRMKEIEDTCQKVYKTFSI